MMNDEHDSDLQRRIAAWREEEKARTPDFERVWRRARHLAANSEPAPAPRLAWRFAGGAAALLLVMATVWVTTQPAPFPQTASTPELGAIEWDLLLAPLDEDLAEPEPPAWSAPTDYLLAAAPDDAGQPIRKP